MPLEKSYLQHKHQDGSRPVLPFVDTAGGRTPTLTGNTTIASGIADLIRRHVCYD